MTAEDRELADVDGASDEALMAAYCAGDQQAFRQLFERYGQRLVRVMRGARISEDTARDLAQQTFLQLHRARADFQAGAKLRPWLMTIAYNLKRDYLRRLGRRPEQSFDPELHGVASTQAQRLQQQQTVDRVRQAVGQLPDTQRAVIELHWFGELSFGEVAQVLGIGESSAKVRAHRGYKQLRQLLLAAQDPPVPVTGEGGAAY